MKNKSIKKNFIMNSLLTMSSFIFPLITFPYVSRILLPIGTGKVSFTTSFVSYFSMIAQLGIPTYGIRACAKVRDNKKELSKTVHELFIINMIMSLIAYMFFFIALFTVPKLAEDRTLLLIMSMTIGFNVIGMEWLYKALEQYSYITIRSLCFKVIALIFMFLLVHNRNDYVIYGAITIFAGSASNILNFINLRKFINFKKETHYELKKHLKAVGIFFAMACAGTIYTNLDTVMLGFMTSDKDVGYYNAAVRIKTILVSIVTSLGTVLLPRASYYIEMKKFNEFKMISKKALNFVILIALPLVIYFILFADFGIDLLSGPSYSKSVLPMQIIMPTILFIGITNILGIQMLVPLGKENIVLISQIVGAIINLLINTMLIPSLFSVGAAIGTLCAEFAVLVVQVIAMKDYMVELIKDIQINKFFISIVLCSLISLVCKYQKLNSFIMLILSGVSFFGVYFSTLIIQKEKLAYEFTCQFMNRIQKGRKK